GDDGVVLPDRIAGYRTFTADATRHPAGKALLLFNSGSSEIFRTAQSLALSEDGRNYRDVPAVAGGIRQALLSPDGGSMLIVERFEATGGFIHLDLKTGKRQDIPLPAPVGVMLHAWSPDGRYVAFAQTPWQGSEASNALELELLGKGVLSVLDLTTWKTTDLPEITPAAAASFAPGSEQLAVQRGSEIWVVNVDGSRARQITLPMEGPGITPRVAWSPDGRWLALIEWQTNGTKVLQPMNGLWTTQRFTTVRFVDATGAGRSAPEPVTAGHVLGWRTPRSIVALDYKDWTISEVSLDDGRRRLLSTFKKAHTCELGTQPCQLEEVQVATGLLSSMTVKSAQDPLRGPWPLWLQLIVAAATVVIGLIVYRIVRRVRRRALANAWQSTNASPSADLPESPRT
ncbi:MAG TPA: hypothetical protein DGT23_10370, partial [Micromonosporaceae bacterium]|nr:hypothetical protein [Micromonosporaceae bacterium]